MQSDCNKEQKQATVEHKMGIVKKENVQPRSLQWWSIYETEAS